MSWHPALSRLFRLDSPLEYPEDEKLFIFMLLREHVWERLPMSLRRFLDLLLFGIGPDVPIGIGRVLAAGAPKRAFLAGAFATLGFSACGTAIASWLSGTLWGNDSTRLYLINDKLNIINYVILCPLYVGLGLSLVVTVAKNWKPLAVLARELSPNREVRRSLLPLWSAPVLAFGFAAASTLEYGRESLDPAIYPKIGWWVEKVASDGTRVLGVVGSYYVILNFALLFICILALLAFLALLARVVTIARGLAAQNSKPDLKIKRSLLPFVKAYIIAKLLTAVLMLNAYTWKYARPQGSFNLIVMGGILAAMGLLFVSLPRYLIEYEWFKAQVRQAQAQGPSVDFGSTDIRPVKIRLIANLLDAVFIGGFVLSFFKKI